MSNKLHKKLKGYATIPKRILCDNTISAKTKVVWLLISSKPDYWNFSAKNISDETKEGVDSIRRSLKELEELGYLSRSPRQGDDGKFSGYDYYFTDEPEQTQNTDDGEANDGNADYGKHPNHTKKVITKPVYTKPVESEPPSNNFNSISQNIIKHSRISDSYKMMLGRYDTSGIDMQYIELQAAEQLAKSSMAKTKTALELSSYFPDRVQKAVVYAIKTGTSKIQAQEITAESLGIEVMTDRIN